MGPRPFKVGDIVKCVEAVEALEQEIGDVSTVLGIRYTSYGWLVNLDNGLLCYARRFELYNPEIKIIEDPKYRGLFE